MTGKVGLGGFHTQEHPQCLDTDPSSLPNNSIGIDNYIDPLYLNKSIYLLQKLN